MQHTGSRRAGPGMGIAVALLCGAAAGPLPAGIGDVDESFGERGAAALVPYGPAYYRDTWQELPGGGLQLFGFERPDARTLRVRLRRYDANGRPDASWNGGREVVTDLVAPADTPWEWPAFTDYASVTVGPMGRMFVVAEAKRADGEVFVVARLRPDGALDTGYGRQGFVSLAKAPVEVRAFPFPQPDGTLLLGIGSDPSREGYGTSVPEEVRRIDANGTLDGSFKSPRAIYSSSSRYAEEWVGLWTRADGTTWVVLDTGILRLNADGSPDRTFGSAGFLEARAAFGAVLGFSQSDPPRSVYVQEAVLLPDGRSVLALAAQGTLLAGGPARLAAGLVRVNADGSRDLSFGPGSTGYAPIDLARFAWNEARLEAVATRLRYAPDGSLALGATVGSTISYTQFEAIALNAPDRTLLFRLSEQGVPDARFGDGGAQLLSVDREPFLVAAQTRGGALIGHGGQLRRLGSDAVAAAGLLSVQPYVKRAEGAGTVLLPVLRAAGSRGAVRLEYATEDGSPINTGADGAIAGSDYESTAGRVDWADGESGLKFVPLRIVDDSAAEKYEYFRMRWRLAAGNATLISGAAAGANIESTTTIEIEASDQPGTFTPSAGAPTAVAPTGTSAGGGGGAMGLATLLALFGAFVRRLVRRRRSVAIDQGLA